MARLIKKIVHTCGECYHKISNENDHLLCGYEFILDEVKIDSIPDWCPLEYVKSFRRFDIVDIVICGETIAKGYIKNKIDNNLYDVIVDNSIKQLPGDYLFETGLRDIDNWNEDEVNSRYFLYNDINDASDIF